MAICALATFHTHACLCWQSCLRYLGSFCLAEIPVWVCGFPPVGRGVLWRGSVSFFKTSGGELADDLAPQHIYCQCLYTFLPGGTISNSWFWTGKIRQSLGTKAIPRWWSLGFWVPWSLASTKVFGRGIGSGSSFFCVPWRNSEESEGSLARVKGIRFDFTNNMVKLKSFNVKYHKFNMCCFSLINYTFSFRSFHFKARWSLEMFSARSSQSCCREHGQTSEDWTSKPTSSQQLHRNIHGLKCEVKRDKDDSEI